jgi:transcriptional regulator with XRE-family HTH domain
MKDRYDAMEIRSLVAQNLKRLRRLKNVSQLDLSGLTGLTHNFINDIENRNKWVSARSLAKLASALEVEPYQFFLSGTQPDDVRLVYLKDFQDSLTVFVRDYSENYISGEPGKTGKRKQGK